MSSPSGGGTSSAGGDGGGRFSGGAAAGAFGVVEAFDLPPLSSTRTSTAWAIAARIELSTASLSASEAGGGVVGLAVGGVRGGAIVEGRGLATKGEEGRVVGGGADPAAGAGLAGLIIGLGGGTLGRVGGTAGLSPGPRRAGAGAGFGSSTGFGEAAIAGFGVSATGLGGVGVGFGGAASLLAATVARDCFFRDDRLEWSSDGFEPDLEAVADPSPAVAGWISVS